MKNLILLLSIVFVFNSNILAEEDESSFSEKPRRSEACENEASRNAFFLIRSNTKEETEARIRETRQTIDSCETNEEGKTLTDQIALMEESLTNAPKGDATAKPEVKPDEFALSKESPIAKPDVPVKDDPKDYLYGDFGEAPKKVAPVAAVAPTPTVSSESETTVEVKKEKPVAKPVVAKPKVKTEVVSTSEVETPVVAKETSKPIVAVKPAAPIKSNERELAEDIAKRAGNVAVNVGTTTKDVTVALVDSEYWDSVGNRVGELKQKAVSGVKTFITPSAKGTQAEDGRGYLERAVDSTKSVAGFVTDKESWKDMGRNGAKLVSGIWDNSVGKVYQGSKVLADGRNDSATNLQAMTDIAAGSVSTVVNGAGAVNGARAAATKVVTYFRTPAGEIVQVTTAANGVVTQKVIRNVTEKASDQAMGSVNSRPPGP